MINLKEPTENINLINEKNDLATLANTPTSQKESKELSQQKINDIPLLSKLSNSESKHKLNPTCLNKCIKWTLKVGRSNIQNGNIKNIYQSDSYYFSKTDASILNTVNNNSLNSDNQIQNQHQQIIENIKNDSNRQLTLNNNKDNICKNILGIKYPIDNSVFNFMIVDANYGNEENLKNLFFLEFDLTQNNNNNNEINIRDINNDCVDKELFFNLNGLLHNDTLIFKNDVVFSLEYRSCIKSIQFRIKNYQEKKKFKELYQKNKYKNNKKYYNYNNNTLIFFAKIIGGNINIGIEFSKSNNDYFHTNFNSIVNSNIKINKIYLEICIPKILFQGINMEKIKSKDSIDFDPKKEEIKKEKEISTEDPCYSVSSNSVTNHTVYNNNNNKNNNNNNINFNNNSKFNIPNNYDRIIYNQHNSPPITIKNNINLNNMYKNNNFNFSSNKINNPMTNNNNNNISQMNNFFHNSPTIPINSTTMSLFNNENLFNINNNNNLDNNNNTNQLLFSPLSPLMQGNFFHISQYTNYVMNNINNLDNNNNMNISQSKFSENCLNKLNQNPLSSFQKMPNMFKTPNINMKANNYNDDFINNIPPQQIFSPKAIHSELLNLQYNMNTITNNSNLNNNNNQFTNFNLNYSKMSPMGNNIHTIHKRIMDWEKNNNNTPSNNAMNQFNTNNNNIPSNNPLNQFNTNSNNNLNYQSDLFKNQIYDDKLSNKNEYYKKNKFEMYPDNKREIFIKYYQDCNNLDIFIKNCSIYTLNNTKNISSNNKDDNDYYLTDYLNSFNKLSTFGIKVLYHNNNNFKELNEISYSCTLSSMEIKIISKEMMNKIISNLYSLKLTKIKDLSELNDELVIVSSTFIQDVTFIISKEYILLSFYSSKPWYNRYTLKGEIDLLFKTFTELKNIKITDIDCDSSWMAILYNKMSCHKNKTSFVVYYPIVNLFNNINSNVDSKNNHDDDCKYQQVDIIGLLPIKFDNNFYLCKFGNPNQILFPIDSQSYLRLNNLINTVTQNIICNSYKQSFDYKSFVESNKEINMMNLF